MPLPFPHSDFLIHFQSLSNIPFGISKTPTSSSLFVKLFSDYTENNLNDPAIFEAYLFKTILVLQKAEETLALDHYLLMNYQSY